MKKKNSNFIKGIWHSDKLLVSLFYLICTFAVSFTAFRMLYVQHKLFAAIAVLVGCIALMFAVFYLFIKKTGGISLAAQKIRRGKVVWLSLLLTAAVSVFIFGVYTLSPIGDYTVLRMDLYHQYGPLFAELYDKIAQGKSLLYSWNSAGGSGFLGNFFNYLSSPFTLLIFWFSKTECVTTGISVIVFAKCIAAAGTFAYYLKKRFAQNNLSIPAFGLLYAFSAYFIAYFWNVMWLDAMVVFPLVILGIERIIDRSNSKIYFFSLIYLFLTNYYMAYMVCIFSAVYFCAYYLSHYAFGALYVPKSRDLPRFSKIRQSRLLCSGLRFATVSVAAALCCSAVLIPIYKVLSASSATHDTFPSEVNLYFDIYDYIAAHFAALEPTVRSSGGDVTPNIYCGIITVLLYPLFLLNKRFGWKDKLINTLLLIGIFAVCNLNITNFVLHGFHFPNDLPYRFSFIYSFLLLVCAYRVFRYIREYDHKVLVAVGAAFAILVVIAQKFDLRYVNKTTIYFSLAFILVYTLILCAIVSKKFSKPLTCVVLCCAVVCEVLVCDVPKFEFGVTESEYVEDYEDYQKAIQAVTENDDSFYRMELSHIPSELRMAPCWYNYRGIDCFSSMASETNAKMQNRLGNASNNINSYMYHSQTPIYNMMFDMKYIIENERPQLNSKYYDVLHGNEESKTTYRNKYDSSLGFALNRSLLKNWKTEEIFNRFEVQNEFIKQATDTDKDCLEPIKVYTDGASGCSITSFENEGNGKMTFSVFDTGKAATISLNFDADKGGNYYLYVGANEDIYDAKIKTSSYTKIQSVDNDPYLLDLGVLKEDEEVKITLNIGEDCAEGEAYVWVARLNDDVFQKAYDQIADDGLLKVEEFSDTYIKGEVTAQKNEILYTSITYDAGWKCYVDGVQVKPYKINDCLIGLETGEGTHTVEFKYTPAGLKIGLIVSGITIAAIAIYFILKKVIIYYIARATDKLLTHEED